MDRVIGAGASCGINEEFGLSAGVRSILVVKRDKVGDLLLATPMLRLLRQAFPAASIEVLASDYNAWVLHGHNAVDRIWEYPRVRAAGRLRVGAAISQAALFLRLRARRFDVAIAANGEDSPRATNRALAVAARCTIAYSSRTSRRLLALPPPAEGHECERLAGLLAPLGVRVQSFGVRVDGFGVRVEADPTSTPTPKGMNPDWTPSEPALTSAREWLKKQGLEPGGYVVIGLGARRPSRQPSAAQVRRWTGAAARAGLATVFMWTPGRGRGDYPGDDDAAQAVLDDRPATLHPFRGPLQPAAALSWLARKSLFPDSGLMHLAAASPGGVVGLFADTARSPPPGRWGPRGPNAHVLVALHTVEELRDEDVLAALLG
jgi:heptosyltransferase-3